jgi:hypothetical protein
MDAALERRLARRAATQSGLITRKQLIAIGVVTVKSTGAFATAG